jgi:hypothetical protein
MNEIARRGGRFITVLPASRKEDRQFRQRLRDEPKSVCWREAYRLTDEDGSLRDLFRVCTEEQLSKEGYRLLWFHSQGKAETDAATRARRLQRASRELADLRSRLGGPRTRFKERRQVTAAVDAILDARVARDFLLVLNQAIREGVLRQRGR